MSSTPLVPDGIVTYRHAAKKGDDSRTSKDFSTHNECLDDVEIRYELSSQALGKLRRTGELVLPSMTITVFKSSNGR